MQEYRSLFNLQAKAPVYRQLVKQTRSTGRTTKTVQQLLVI